MTVTTLDLSPQRKLARWLRSVLPDRGRYCLMHRGGSESAPRHEWFDSVFDLAGVALERSAQKRDCWFALATFDSARSRKKEHVVWLRSLFLDIDVKPGDASYYCTLDEARTAIEAFEQAFFSASSIVCSGNGLHAYWSVDRDLPPGQWEDLAGRFKALTKLHGIRADPTCTADAARVLRVPGTSNLKNPNVPRAVLIEREGNPIKLDALEENLPALLVLPATGQSGPLVDLCVHDGLSYHWFDALPIKSKRDELGKMLGVLGTAAQDGRDTWYRVGAALRGVAGLDTDECYLLWQDWSCQQSFWAGRWNDAAERERFDGFTKSGIGALVKLAREHGYRHKVSEPTQRFQTPEEAGQWLCDEFVFVETEGGYRRFDGVRVNVETFNRINARHMPMMGNNGRALSADRIAMESGYVERVADVGYSPGDGHIYEDDGRRRFNLWTRWLPVPIKPSSEFAEAFAMLIEHLRNGDTDTGKMLSYFLKSMAWLVQHPRDRLQKLLLLIGQTQGSGKTTLMLEIPRRLFGTRNVGCVGTNEVSSDFNSWAAERRVILFDELWLGSRKESEQRANDLKPLISDSRARIHAKGKDGYEVRNVASIFATSNYLDAAHVSESDRRWAIAMTTAGPMQPEQARKLYSLLNAPDAPGMLVYIFWNMKLGDFAPYADPPMSRAKQRAIEASRDDVRELVIAAWQDKTGPFARDIVTAEAVGLTVATALDRNVSRGAIVRALQGEPLQAQQVVTTRWINGKSCTKRGWVVRNHAQWTREKSAGDQYDELHKAIEL
jgi:hypothetical protein